MAYIYKFDALDDGIPFTDSVQCMRKRIMLV